MSSTPSDTKKQKAVKSAQQTSILESLKGIGDGVGKSLSQDLFAEGSKDIFRQLLAQRMQQRKYSGEIRPGEDLPINDVFSGRREKEEKLQRQLSLERSLREQEQSLVTQRSQEMRMQLRAIMEEIKNIAAATPQLAEELEIASTQAPVNPGVYHVVFFEKILSFVQSFRKNITAASSWLHAVNARAKKGGNVWGANYKKGKGSYLLSAEHYVQRSAG